MNKDQVTLVSEGDEKFSIPLEAVELSSVIKEELECHDEDSTEDLTCTSKIKPRVLSKVAEFLTHHATVEKMNEIETPFKTDKIGEIVQEWYADFIAVERTLVFEIVLAANFLDITPLLRLAVLAVSVDITGKSADEIRTIFNISNDLNDPVEKAKVMEENAWAFEAKRQFEKETERIMAEKAKKDGETKENDE